MTTGPILELRGVTRRYAGRAVVDGAELALEPGRIACLLGPSGCGKSTLLRMVAGLEPVDAGEIRIHGDPVSGSGVDVAAEARGVGLVFQDNALFPHLDVAGNVAFGIRHLAAADRRVRVSALLERFHIAHLAAAWPHTLSGGEQQRVAIARALAREPALLLLDEPFSGLDGELRINVRSALIADLRNVGTTVLIVTHDPEEAMLIADDLILMAAGRILQTGTPAECFDQPVSAAAARLLGEAIVFPASVADGIAATPWGPVPAAGVGDGPAEAMVRPGSLRLTDHGVEAHVGDVRRIGQDWLLELVVAGERLALRSALPAVAGAAVRLSADPAAIRLFPAS